MDRTEINGPNSPSISAACGGSARSPPKHKYNSRAVQEALEHLASIDLIELRYEAKVERCRATRDLRSCGRYVHHVLNSCGHASLCTECSQRCDFCPICRIPVPKEGDRFRLRLFYECIEAGLISRKCDERFQDLEDGENQLTADVQRLYSLFDVALENNLVSLICHYVRDVCMDEAAVSSDPVVAFLLDEVVVKDWCKRTFQNIISELKGIYNLEVEEMKTRLSLLLKFSVQLAGISNVVEILASSFKDDLSAQVHDLQHLQESMLKTKQHLEIMLWCAKHQFLENVRSRYDNFMSWRSLVRQRKSAATRRAWFDPVNYSAESTRQDGTLFIEDALANLEIEQEYTQASREEIDVTSLHKDDGGLSFFRSKIEGVSGCYPFENLRSAVDILFLHGSSDLVVAKQAIFLYYLFDRQWTVPDENWRHLVDDFAVAFCITRHSLLESLTFYLLDDDTDEALQEACHLLPEISGPATHPKIARVLLERENPETALMLLRWSGRGGASQLVSLSEAVTAVRVRVECALLTEAFTYQRMLCTKVREEKLKYGPSGGSRDDLKGDSKSWEQWVEILVTEICCLCIRRNLVDRMIELPWNSEEEKYLHKCLLDSAIDDPSTTIGCLLVIFYVQRYRYAEAYQVNLKLQSVEQDFLSKNPVAEEVLSKMQSQIQWRNKFVDTSVELLPEVEQQLIKTCKLPVIPITSGEEVEVSAKSDLSESPEEKSTGLLAPVASADSSLLLSMHHVTSAKSSLFESPTRPGVSANNLQFEVSNNDFSSILHQRLFSHTEGTKSDFGVSKDFKFDDISNPGNRRPTLLNPTPFKEVNNMSRPFRNSHHKDKLSDKISPEAEKNGFMSLSHPAVPSFSRMLAADPASTPSSKHDLRKDSVQERRSNLSSKRVHSDRDDETWNVVSSEEPMDIFQSHENNTSAVEERYTNLNGGPRWRSDETSDEEDEQSPDNATKLASYASPVGGRRTGSMAKIRRSRFARR